MWWLVEKVDEGLYGSIEWWSISFGCVGEKNRRKVARKV